MKKRAILTTVVAFLLLVAVIAAGLNAVFTVTYVNARFLTYTEEGETAARELKEDLNEYLGKSTTFLDLEEVRRERVPRFRGRRNRGEARGICACGFGRLGCS